MDDTIFFNDTPLPNTPTPSKPTDDFRPLPLSATTILYLAITTPHTDTFTLHGPVSSFPPLLPKITDLCSDSPSALDKLDALQHTPADVWGDRAARPEFQDQGFTTFVVEGQRGTYTVLRVLVVEDKAVRDVVPGPVYTVSRHGPLVHAFVGVGAKTKMMAARGVSATSALVGCYVEREDAVAAARAAMERLVQHEEGVSRMEEWEKGGGGLVLAMLGGKRWEVRVQYDGEALRRAREEADKEGAVWRF